MSGTNTISVHERQTIQTLLAKEWARAFTKYLVSLGIAAALISLSFTYAAMPESNWLARANQEQIHVVQR